MSLTPHDIARMLDHSTLQPFLTEDDIRRGCELALKYDTASVCARPCDVPILAEMLRGTLAGARAKLRIAPAEDGPYMDIAESTLEGIGAINVDVANGFWLQAVLENASTGTSCDGFFGGGVYTR